MDVKVNRLQLSTQQPVGMQCLSLVLISRIMLFEIYTRQGQLTPVLIVAAF